VIEAKTVTSVEFYLPFPIPTVWSFLEYSMEADVSAHEDVDGEDDLIIHLMNQRFSTFKYFMSRKCCVD
jgi:hypothetical protein